MELSPESGMVKIGTWTDRHRLRITDNRDVPFIKAIPPRGGYKPNVSYNPRWANVCNAYIKINKFYSVQYLPIFDLLFVSRRNFLHFVLSKCV